MALSAAQIADLEVLAKEAAPRARLRIYPEMCDEEHIHVFSLEGEAVTAADEHRVCRALVYGCWERRWPCSFAIERARTGPPPVARPRRHRLAAARRRGRAT